MKLEIKHIIIIVILILLVFLLLQNKKTEGLDASSGPSLSNEAIQSIASVYSNTDGTVTFNNAKIKKTTIKDATVTENLDVSGNTTLKNTIVAGNFDISGNLLKKQNKARYIRVGNNVDSAIPYGDYWTITEIEVYDTSGVNVAKNKAVTITVGTAYNSAFPVSNAVNGSAPREDSNYYHGNTGKNEIEIDLGQEYLIDHIVLYNRYNEEQSTRLDNTSIQLLDSNKKRNRIIFTGNWYQTYSKEYVL